MARRGPLPAAALVTVVLALGVFLVAGGPGAPAVHRDPSLALLPLPQHLAPDAGRAPAQLGGPARTRSSRATSAHDALAKGPLAFERGRSGAYRTRGNGYELFIDGRGSQMVLRGNPGRPLRTELVGAAQASGVAAGHKLPLVVNRFSGPPATWQAGIPTFGRVTYKSVYPGIDLRYHGAKGQLEYDFVLQPGADPRRVALEFHGASGVRLTRTGDLLVRVGNATVRQHRPVTYQRIDGRRVPIRSRFVLDGRRVRFEVGRYAKPHRLVIDPSLTFGDYVGGSGTDNGGRVAVDSSGNIYLAATSASSSIPGGATVKHSKSTGKDAFVMKIRPDGTREWITYVGGSGTDQANDIGVDSSGRPVVVGETRSSADFPVTNGAFQTTFGGGLRDGFITALAADGSIRWSTLLGSTAQDTIGGVSVTPSGSVYVALNLETFDGQGNPIPPMRGYVYTFDPNGGAQWQYTQGDGTADDTVDGVVPLPGCDSSDCQIFMTGHTKVDDPDGAVGDKIRVGYVRRYNFATLTEVWYETFTNPTDENRDGVLEWPGGEWPSAIATDPAGNPVVTGTTHVGTHDWMFLVRFGRDTDGDGVIIDSPYVLFSVPPLNGDSFAGDVATDAQGNVYSVGTTLATNGSGLDAVQPKNGGAYDAGVLKYFPDGPPKRPINGDPTGAHPNARIVWATALGGADNDTGMGIVTDGQGGTYVSGEAGSSFIPSPRTQSLAATPDAYVVKIQTNSASITDGPSGTVKAGDQTFKYSSGETGGTYECRLVTPSSPSPGFSSCSEQSDFKSLADGSYQFEVKAWDSGGTSNGDVTRRTFQVDSSPGPAFSIAPNPALVGRPVTFDGSASSAATPIAKYEWDLDGNGSFEKDTGTTPTVTQVYPSAGSFNVGLRITDGAGRTGTTTNTLQVNNATGPGTQFGVTINDGAQFTNDPNVTVTATFPTFTTGLLFSNDGGFGKAQTFAAKKDTPWKLDSSGPERLPKTIYVRFLTGSISSTSFQDDIILDETPPKVDDAVVDPVGGDAAPAAAQAAKARLRKYKIKMKATDKTSGVNKVQVTSNKRKPGKALRYKRKFVVKSAKKPKWVRARDRAGNWSKWKKAR